MLSEMPAPHALKMFRKTTVNSRRHEKLLLYVPLVLWIGLILFLSSGQGAMTQTSRFIRPLLEFLLPSASPETLDLYHGYIRKLAHPSVYAVLAFWSWRAFRGSAAGFFQRNVYIASFSLALLIASADELNQSFLSSRTGTPWDVALDAAGASIALGVLCLFDRRKAL